MTQNTNNHLSTLPRLPVPELKPTLQKYIESLKPLCKLKNKNLEDYVKICKDFEEGLGKELQTRLLKHDQTQKNSWLEEWWFKYAYLMWKDPLLINSNWHCSILDEAEQSKLLSTKSRYDHILRPYTAFQIKRASKLVYYLVEYCELIENDMIKELLPISSRNKCLNQYKMMFGCCRIPSVDCDYLKVQHPIVNDHIVLMVKDQFYKVVVFDKNRQKLSIQQIENQLYSIVLEVNDKNYQKDESVSILTAIKRDEWAKARSVLLQTKSNAATLTAIEDSLFVLSLDDYITPNDENIRHLNYFHAFNGHNRWFDKTLNFIVDASGSAGLNGEHSPLDAIIPTLAFTYAAKEHFTAKDYRVEFEPTKEEVKRYRIKTNAVITNKLKQAQTEINTMISNSDSYIYTHNKYGSTFIKSVAKVSPDAYIQMAIQLAYYKMYNCSVSTYETGGTTKFHHGRTDAVRTLSQQSLRFVESMFEEQTNINDRFVLLKAACDQHIKYVKDVMDGRGVDRHLLGLKLVMNENEAHPIFDEDLFKQSQAWTLSTSTIGYLPLVASAGFGTVDPAGYGINYRVNPDFLSFGIESKNTSSQTLKSRSFANSLEWAFEKMEYIVMNCTLELTTKL